MELKWWEEREKADAGVRGVDWHLPVEKPGFQPARRQVPEGRRPERDTIMADYKNTDRARKAQILLVHTRLRKVRDLKIQPTDREEVGTAELPAPLGAGPERSRQGAGARRLHAGRASCSECPVLPGSSRSSRIAAPPPNLD